MHTWQLHPRGSGPLPGPQGLWTPFRGPLELKQPLRMVLLAEMAPPS